MRSATEEAISERRGPEGRSLVAAGESPPGERAGARLDRLFVLAAMAVTASISLVGLGRPSLWYDEGSSLALATMPLSEFATHTAETEASGSLYYLLLRVWMTLGQEPWMLRSLSVIFAVATLPVAFGLLRRLLGHRVARLATALLAISPMFVEWAREIRPYSLALLLITGTGYAFVRALRSDGRGWRIVWVVAGAASVSAHLVSLFVIVAQIAVLPLLVPRSRLLPMAVGAAAMGALLAPLLWFAVTSGEQIDWIPELARWQVEGFAREITGASANRFVVPAGGFAAVGAATLLVRARRPLDRQRRSGYLLLSWTIVPVALLLAVSFVRPMFVPRYLICILPAFVALVALGIDRLRRWPRLEALALATVVALTVPSLAALYSPEGKQDLRRVVALVAAGWEEGDALAREAGTGLGVTEYYVTRSSLGDELPVTLFGGPGPQSYRGDPDVLDFRLTDPGRPITARRVWLDIHPDEFATDVAAAITSHGLPPEWRPVRSWDVPGGYGRVLLLLEAVP